MSRFRFFLVTLPLLAYLIFIFVLSSLEFRNGGVPIRNLDKVIHFFLYLVMPILFARYFRRSSTPAIRDHFMIYSIVISLLFAATDEWHQFFVSSRHCSFHDWLADAAGVFFGAAVYRLYLNFRGRYEKA
ncbi:MAG: VanZ family protein [Candidatus Omnitrophica bacterium]|nr:VanZ family protein [Candidatus Omnitrophota bacterium]